MKNSIKFFSKIIQAVTKTKKKTIMSKRILKRVWQVKMLLHALQQDENSEEKKMQ